MNFIVNKFKFSNNFFSSVKTLYLNTLLKYFFLFYHLRFKIFMHFTDTHVSLQKVIIFFKNEVVLLSK